MALKKIQSADRDLNLVQDNVDSAFRDLERVDFLTAAGLNTASPTFTLAKGSLPFLGGVVIQSLPLISGQDNLVPHALGKAPSYWMMVRKNANADVWEAVTSKLVDSSGVSQSVNRSYINLKCSANVTITLWVA